MESPSQASGHTSGSTMSALEEMPNLAKKITLMWPSRELDTFIQRAVLDGRDGDRQGFPMAVGTELLFLSELNKVVRAFDLAARLQIKPSEAYRMVEQGDREALQPGGGSAWADPMTVGSSRTRASDIPRSSASQSLLKPKAKPRRSLFSKIFSIR